MSGNVASTASPNRLDSPAYRPGPLIIGIAGGSDSGKTAVCNVIVDRLKHTAPSRVAIINLQSFYKELNENEVKMAQEGEMNFDHPDAFDFDLVQACLETLSRGSPVTIPEYNKATYRRQTRGRTIDPPDIIMLVGILVLYPKELRQLLDMMVFVDVDSDERLGTRVKRKCSESPDSVAHVINHYIRFVKPSFEEFVLPTKKYADIIIPRGHHNTAAVDLLYAHINDVLRTRSRSTTSTPTPLTPISTAPSSNTLSGVDLVTSPLRELFPSPSEGHSTPTPSGHSAVDLRANQSVRRKTGELLGSSGHMFKPVPE
ncbi:hypothetical protein BZG36_04434 [Bifiguratus adelaidae]|uniref:uridine/cytidine kinase n=1 Tax=Bifiguratus adelaidae TaxID=1938954 RepID=A0A261XVJ2_9FUNG|nr:hypothetical protein BZG36_04434 [Bifiguratus adelaidae]